MLDLILERAQSILDGNKARALKAIAIHDTKQHKHLVINDFDELNDLNYKGVILLKSTNRNRQDAKSRQAVC